jgi:sortase (surface protein transpeptidase)
MGLARRATTRHGSTVVVSAVRRRQGAANLLLGVALGLGIAAVVVALLQPSPPRAENSVLPSAVTPTHVSTAQARHIQPVSVSIPAIGVTSPLMDLGRNADGTLQTPDDYAVAGWFAAGAAPGDTGGPPAIIAGHVDSPTGPAVFYRLGELPVGSDIELMGLDSVVRRFTVYQVTTFPKDAFPTKEVYAPTNRAEVRLITCTGDFDRAAGRYLSNVVVYATQTGG